eukprot:SAG22_NODE_11649_length_475_cov_1.393617_1_plen_45_part_10
MPRAAVHTPLGRRQPVVPVDPAVDKTRGEPYDVSRIIWFHPWSCQ